MPPARDHVPRLRSIVLGEARALALIDDTYLREGERYGDVHVLKIYPERVVVRLASGRQRTLTLAADKVTKEFQ